MVNDVVECTVGDCLCDLEGRNLVGNTYVNTTQKPACGVSVCNTRTTPRSDRCTVRTEGVQIARFGGAIVR
jgi:hypothetical protein